MTTRKIVCTRVCGLQDRVHPWNTEDIILNISLCVHLRTGVRCEDDLLKQKARDPDIIRRLQAYVNCYEDAYIKLMLALH